MNPSLPLLLAAVLAAAPSRPPARSGAAPAPAKPAAIPAGWTQLTSEKGGFRAAFPSKPEEEASTQDTEAGQARTLTYSVSGDDGFLAVSVTQFAAGTMSQTPADKVLEGARDGAIANVGGTLLSWKPATLSPAPRQAATARDYEAKTKDGLRVSARLVLAGDRLYQIIHVRPAEANDAFQKLAASFTLLP